MASKIHQEEVVKVSEIDPSSWRLRDASHRLLYRRHGPESDTVAPRQSANNMFMSSNFHAEACLTRIRRDRASVVRSAFDAAATAVLEAIVRNVAQHVKKQRRKSLTLQQNDLPPFLTQFMRLEEVRLASIERAHNNKEIAKAKRPVMTAVPVVKKIITPKAEPGAEAVTTTTTTTTSTTSGAEPTASQKKKPMATPAEEPLRKFTRNTPASSAAALDSRSMTSRAILCTAGNISFEALTPRLPGFDIEVTDIPQNPAKDGEEAETAPAVVNMGNVVIEAQTLGQRSIAVATNTSRKAAQRYQYRKDNLQFSTNPQPKHFFRMKNPFQGGPRSQHDDEDVARAYLEETVIPHQPHPDAITGSWIDMCLPRFLSILDTGAGHAYYHDVQWGTRHGRIADLFRVLAEKKGNYGTHLIITTEPEVTRFAREFQPVNHHQALLHPVNTESLRALAYTGDKEQRRKLRYYFPKATGLVDSPYHVLITSYRSFLENYLHFCQLPFETVVVDDGASWMAAAKSDPNSPIGLLWDTAMWSKKDHVGLAGTSYKKWNFMVDDIPLQAQKEAWIGLTARSRIMTGASSTASQPFSGGDVLPCHGLVDFVAPYFSSTAKEEWDRCKIQTDPTCMDHFRGLLTRSTVVHQTGASQDLHQLAIEALNGRSPVPDRSADPGVPTIVADETFVSDGKAAFSRRGALFYLGDPERSWLRYELGTVSFKPILDVQSKSATYGFFCEETVPASVTTPSGSAGQVAGTLAYRLAVRCNRHFGSEQGLRQHISAQHAPPGTWLCRTCGTDCITSQARTHHERTCGQPITVSGDTNGPGGGGGVGSRQNYGPVGVVGKKKGQRPGAPAQGGAKPEDKDPDGSIRLPTYRGVWVNKVGKHFVKIKGTRLKAPGGEETLFFDSIDDAAKGHDEAVKAQAEKDGEQEDTEPKVELNYEEGTGTRIVYEDSTAASTTGLGGSANNVVPALSVINIKDLPADVKPLLRDPRQTSRTGGNSKRHVYAYRGVCRQARKGHDRWQSQISFMGVNHYLGTFDSEWDAAAIYAWAHLILYGEEATRKAQLEGEEAAAAYEQEKKDIAEGKMVPAPPKPEKKAPKPKQKIKKSEKRKGKEKKPEKKSDGKTTTVKSKKRKLSVENKAPEVEKKKMKIKIKGKPGRKPTGEESIAPILMKGVYRAFSLTSERFLNVSVEDLIVSAAPRMIAARDANYCVSADKNRSAPVDDMLRPCLPQSAESTKDQAGAAMLVGLSSKLFGWDVNAFVSSRVFDSVELEKNATAALTSEVATNESFRTLLQGPLCVIGNASPSIRKAHKQLGLGAIPIGGPVGEIDCHIGGTLLSCSETAAAIRFASTTASDFQFAALNDEDIVTLNGKRITPGMGSFPLFTEDICTVGARVFVFLRANIR